MNILSLFSGIGAFEKALTNLGVSFSLVNYCEIDKYASKSYSAIHGISEDLNLWDITKVDTDKIPRVDLITYGFPCQDISVAGKQAGLGEGTRSGLYREAYRIIKAKLPKYAICENVKNLTGKKFKEQFDAILNDLEQLGYTNYWKVLNARDYGIPQNRERVFIISIRGEHEPFEFPTPFDNGLRLKDMLEDEVDEKYYISQDKVDKLLKSTFAQEREKIQTKDTCSTLLARDYKDPKCVVDEKLNREYSHSICASIGRTTEREYFKKNQGQLCAVLTPDRAEKRQNGRRFKEDGEPMFTLTGQDRHGVLEKVGCIGADSQGNRVYSADGLASAQCGTAGGLGAKTGLYLTNYRIRKLTPKECFRLMAFADTDFEKAKYFTKQESEEILIKFPKHKGKRIFNHQERIERMSNSQLYKQAGNSICVNVLEEIFKKLLER